MDGVGFYWQLGERSYIGYVGKALNWVKFERGGYWRNRLFSVYWGIHPGRVGVSCIAAK